MDSAMDRLRERAEWELARATSERDRWEGRAEASITTAVYWGRLLSAHEGSGAAEVGGVPPATAENFRIESWAEWHVCRSEVRRYEREIAGARASLATIAAAVEAAEVRS